MGERTIAQLFLCIGISSPALNEPCTDFRPVTVICHITTVNRSPSIQVAIFKAGIDNEAGEVDVCTSINEGNGIVVNSLGIYSGIGCSNCSLQVGCCSFELFLSNV